uniref:Uncharacterized protein n=1 Tax=Arundo donax TaxID=35708 RepID=A0A0A8YCT1_ARUDO
MNMNFTLLKNLANGAPKREVQ